MPHRYTCEHSRDQGPGPDRIPMIFLKCGGESYEKLNFDPLMDLISGPFPREMLIWPLEEEMAAMNNICGHALNSLENSGRFTSE